MEKMGKNIDLLLRMEKDNKRKDCVYPSLILPQLV